MLLSFCRVRKGLSGLYARWLLPSLRIRTKDKRCEVLMIISKRQTRAISGRREERFLTGLSLLRSSCSLLIENKHPRQSIISIFKSLISNLLIKTNQLSQTYLGIARPLSIFLKRREKEIIFNEPLLQDNGFSLYFIQKIKSLF